MTKNCTIDKIKLIMEAGTFNTLDDAMSQFVNSCTDATGQSKTVLFYNGNYRGRGNFRFFNNNNSNRGYYINNRGREIDFIKHNCQLSSHLKTGS